MTSPQVGTHRYYPAAQSLPRIELGPIRVISSVANLIVYPIDNPNDYKFHLVHLNLEYSLRLKTADRCWYKRDLYEIYKWERNNLDKDLKRKQTVWLEETLQKRLPVKRPIEN